MAIYSGRSSQKPTLVSPVLGNLGGWQTLVSPVLGNFCDADRRARPTDFWVADPRVARPTESCLLVGQAGHLPLPVSRQNQIIVTQNLNLKTGLTQIVGSSPTSSIWCAVRTLHLESMRKSCTICVSSIKLKT